ncbi:hypothetical protein KPB2_5546 [Klebsiella pneumoniae Kb677]|nr:hypothetical protein KPB2_5546 [Klebsiella pneumoniae Kb677]
MSGPGLISVLPSPLPILDGDVTKSLHGLPPPSTLPVVTAAVPRILGLKL